MDGLTADGLIWCSTRSATVGLVVKDNRVVDCPPYARRWALGRDAREVWRQQTRASAMLVWIPDGVPFGRTLAVKGAPAPDT